MTVKAFELVSVLEKVSANPDRNELPKLEIECIGVDGKRFYVGTSEGIVLLYNIGQKAVESAERGIKAEGRTVFDCQLCAHKSVSGQRKPIEQLVPVSLTRHLLVVSDSSMLVLDSSRLEVVHGPIRSAVCVSLDRGKNVNNPFAAEICVALKKKALQLYNLTEEQLIPTREISLPEPASLVTLIGNMACVALQTRYVFADCRTGKVTTLFPYSDEADTETRPIVKAVGEVEYLLGGPGGLGMFITPGGIAGRPPLAWDEMVQSVACFLPYVVSMSERSLTVHSILDQQIKQVLQFQTGRGLAETADCIFVASAKALFALVPVPILKQIQSLLSERCVDEALTLARSVFAPSASDADGSEVSQQNAQTLRIVEQQAAFVEFSLGRLEEARSLFVSGGADAREIISLFPGLLPDGVTYPRSASAAPLLVDVDHLCKGNAGKLENYKTFLLSYLESGCYSTDSKKEAHTALLKLYAERHSSQLCEFAEYVFEGFFDECIRRLKACGCHHAAAMLHLRVNEPDKALDIWTKLLQGELTDADFGHAGLSYVTKVLTGLKDFELVMKYCDVVLRRDQLLGAAIFTKRGPALSKDSDVNPDSIIERLEPYRDCLIAYIEHLINDKKQERDVYNTHLAMLYLDSISDCSSSAAEVNGDLGQLRSKLQTLLRSRASYQAQQLLARIMASEQLSSLLLEERATLHGRLGQHDQALRILALRTGSQMAGGPSAAAALRYCLLNSSGTTVSNKAADAKRLFYVLISIYIEEASTDPRFVVPAVDLLNSPEAAFDAVKVLGLLPEHWSVALLTPFLLSSALRSLSDSRMAKVHRGLALRESERVCLQLQLLQNRRVVVTDDRACDFCKKTFTEPSFVFLPNGAICHAGSCAKNFGGGVSL